MSSVGASLEIGQLRLLGGAERAADKEQPDQATSRRRNHARSSIALPGTLAAIHLFFPDPWPKKRHHKRRLVQPAFAALAAKKLAPGGVLHAATDWPDYADQMESVFRNERLLEPARAGFSARPVTKFESRGRRLGHPVRDLAFRRKEKAPAGR